MSPVSAQCTCAKSALLTYVQNAKLLAGCATLVHCTYANILDVLFLYPAHSAHTRAKAVVLNVAMLK